MWPFLLDTDRVCANLKQKETLVFLVFKTVWNGGKKDEIHNQFIVHNNNIDVGKFSGFRGGCCSNESPDYYTKQIHKSVMSFQRFI